MSKRATIRATQQELWALGAAAVYAACTLSENEELSDRERAVLMDGNARAVALIKTSGIDPTTLKTFGLALINKGSNL